jgi:hypothetical protein
MNDPTEQPVRIEYKGQKYIVKYRHDQTPDIIKGKYTDLVINGKTEAFIGDYDTPIDGVVTTAFCSEHDNFSKNVGRIVSTIRLLKKLGV